MSWAYTLDNAIPYRIPLEAPRGLHGTYTNDIDIGLPNRQWMKQAALINPAANDRADLRAPGIRNQIPRPPMPWFGPQPDSAFFRWGASGSNAIATTAGISGATATRGGESGYNYNPPAILNTDQQVVKQLWDHRGQEWYGRLNYELRRTAPCNHWSFNDRGSFSVASSGFSPFASLVPRSTMAAL